MSFLHVEDVPEARLTKSPVCDVYLLFLSFLNIIKIFVESQLYEAVGHIFIFVGTPKYLFPHV